MDFKQTLDNYKKQVDNELEQFFSAKEEEAKEIAPEMAEMVSQLKEVVIRAGKRIRPILFIIAYKAFNPENHEEAVQTSISLELLHNSLLVHDDIIDNGDIRHNGPTIHKVYENSFRQKGKSDEDSRKFGESVAIMAGDLLFGYSSIIIANADFPRDLKAKLFYRHNTTLNETAFGEVLDVMEAYRDIEETSDKDIERINFYKTAKYTFENPLLSGAILAGADEKELKALSEYGINMGMAFQIQDNILGIFGSEEKLGKPCDSDLKEGKKSLLLLHAMKNCTPEQRSKIISSLNNPDITMKDIEEVRKILLQSGSLEYAKKLADAHTDKAIKALNNLNCSEESKAFLKEFALYLKNRDY